MQTHLLYIDGQGLQWMRLNRQMQLQIAYAEIVQ